MEELFVGFGAMIMLLAFASLIFSFAYVMWQFAKESKLTFDRIEAYGLMEILQLNKYALTKGINIDKERLKRDFFKSKSKSFTKRLEEEVVSSFFGKDKEEK